MVNDIILFALILVGYGFIWFLICVLFSRALRKYIDRKKHK